ncbi:MAG: hypothetical protein COA38_11605 [Fluviicola sp.]|nr:MAG: hypothetical protein COA38_11605 [Fluviicola sp.]
MEIPAINTALNMHLKIVFIINNDFGWPQVIYFVLPNQDGKHYKSKSECAIKQVVMSLSTVVMSAF